MASLSRLLIRGLFLTGWKWMMMMIMMVMNIPTIAAVYHGYKPGPWGLAHATFYGGMTATPDMGGACGYANLITAGYGTQTAALSTPLFQNGNGCGTCYQIKCVQSPHCYAPITTVTATNLCPPNWAESSDDGGWCNPPRIHFDMARPAFDQIADWHAGIVPVLYRRVQCVKKTGIQFQLQGNGYWLLVYAMNVGGAGDIGSMYVKGTKTGWIKMSHNWGISFQAFASLTGQALSFRVASLSSNEVIIAWNVAPSNWAFGATYQAKVNFH